MDETLAILGGIFVGGCLLTKPGRRLLLQLALLPLALTLGFLLGLFGVGNPWDCCTTDPDRETYQ